MRLVLPILTGLVTLLLTLILRKLTVAHRDVIQLREETAELRTGQEKPPRA